MPCLLALLAFFAPRLVLIMLLIFSHVLGDAYESVVWPLLGFFFMPLTTLAYAAAIYWYGSVSGLCFFMVLMAALADLGVLGGAGWRQRKVMFISS